MVMTHLDHLETLGNLLVAFPVLTISFSDSFTAITKAILRSSQYRELQQYLFAIVAARYVGPLDKKQLEYFLDCHFGEELAHQPLPASVPRNQESLEYIISVLEVVESFVTYAISVWEGLPTNYTSYGEKLPTTFHMRRVFLRIKLHIELFHQPRDLSDSTFHWKEQFLIVRLFWSQYGEWETRECTWVYDSVIRSAKDAFDYRALRAAQDEDSIQHRKLSYDHQMHLRYLDDFIKLIHLR
jgi:hypothetical protein